MHYVKGFLHLLIAAADTAVRNDVLFYIYRSSARFPYVYQQIAFRMKSSVTPKCSAKVGTDMQMTNEEIVRSYSEAKNKSKQIRILAELNAVSPSEIVKIVKRA